MCGILYYVAVLQLDIRERNRCEYISASSWPGPIQYLTVWGQRAAGLYHT
jgi:hypothetical protein